MSLKDLSNLGVAESLGLAGPLISNPNQTAVTSTFGSGLLANATPYQIISLDPSQAAVVGAWYRLNFYLETTSVLASATGSGPFRVYATYNSSANSLQAGQSSQMVIVTASTAQASKYSFTGTLVFQAIDPTTSGLSFGINVDHQVFSTGAPTGTAVKVNSITYNVTNLTLQRIGYGPAPTANALIKTLNTS